MLSTAALWASAGFLDLSPVHLVILLVVVLLFFGPSRLPELSKAIGKSVRYFKKGLHDIQDELETPPSDEKKESTSPPPTWSEGSIVKTAPPAEKKDDEEKKNG